MKVYRYLLAKGWNGLIQHNGDLTEQLLNAIGDNINRGIQEFYDNQR